MLGRMEAEKKRDLEYIVKLARSRGIFFLFANQNKENQADGVMASLCDLLSYNLRLEEENGIYRRVLKRMNTASAYGDGDRLDEISGEMSQTEVADVRNSRVDAILKKWKTHLPGSRTWLKTSLPTKDDVPDAVDEFGDGLQAEIHLQDAGDKALVKDVDVQALGRVPKDEAHRLLRAHVAPVFIYVMQLFFRKLLFVFQGLVCHDRFPLIQIFILYYHAAVFFARLSVSAVPFWAIMHKQPRRILS